MGRWFFYDPTSHFTESIPGMDNQPENLKSLVSQVNIGEFFERFDGIAADIIGQWPRFRGINFDNKSNEHVDLKWGDSGPQILWSVDLGEGHAGPAIYNGRVYIMDYDEINRADALRCLSLGDGKDIWRRWYNNPMKRNHGMSRTIPAVNDRYVVTIGPQCHVMCVDADSGNFRWGIDLVQDYNTTVPLWYTGQCPLLEDSVAVIAPGGTSLIIAVNCRTGEIAWQTPNPNNWQMSHSSIMPWTFNGKKMYVYCAIGGIVGISAEGEDIGQILWESPDWNQNVIAPSPVFLEDGKIFVTAGYGAGSMMFQLEYANGIYNLQTLQKIAPKDGLASEQQTPILYQGHLFCVLPKDAGPMRNQYVCCDPDDITQFVWTSGKTNRFGLGPFIMVDNKFFILSDEGVLTVIQASTDEYKELAKVKILDGTDAWGPLAVANKRMLLRDSKKMVCIEI
ncbi:PQQ-binding-like beta-propeller repeat protein [candidate division KSB1 bacterium]|nr:PQQ-binding-like beta-propeller repeat protein [candidate division KSB1 bacterium]